MTYRCLEDGHRFDASRATNGETAGLLPLCPRCATVGLPDEEETAAQPSDLAYLGRQAS